MAIGDLKRKGNEIKPQVKKQANKQCFILFCSFPLLFAFVVGGLGYEFCVFVAGWRHALRSEWPFIIIIIIKQQAKEKQPQIVKHNGTHHPWAVGGSASIQAAQI